MSAGGAQRLAEALARAPSPLVVEWRVEADGRAEHVVAEADAVSVGPPAAMSDVKVELSAADVDALLSDEGELLELLASQRVRIAGRIPAVATFLRSLPPLAPGLSWLAAVELPAADEIKRRGLPLELTSEGLDQLLLVALVLRSLSPQERGERRRVLLDAVPDGPPGDAILTRLLISTADLAAGNSDHLSQRAELQVVTPER